MPHEFFITKGKGESNIGSPGLPYEIGSYELALTSAKIQNANIIEYTSIIPKESKEIPRNKASIQWGEVLECIKSQTNGSKGEFISCALMVTNIYDSNHRFIGGIACEYSGSGSKSDSETIFMSSIGDLIERRGFGKVVNLNLYKDNVTTKGFIIHPGKHFIYESMKIQKLYGTVITAICFVSYKIPIKNNKQNKIKQKMKLTRKSRQIRMN